MNSHIGLAFSVEHISYAHFIRDYQNLVLDHIGFIPYSVIYDERNFFKENNISNLAHLIRESFKKTQIDLQNVSVSIESNLAKLKRITLPPNLDEKGEFEHINWDLTQALSLPLKDYVYHIAPNHFEFNSLYDTLVVAIQKRVINFFKSFADFSKVKLENLSVHSLSAELALRNSLENRIQGLLVLFKIAQNRLETIYIWNGSYFSSEYEIVKVNESSYSYNEIILDRIKLKIKQVENLFEQYGRKSSHVEQIYLYGEMVNEAIIELIQKNISIPVNRLNPFHNLTYSESLQNDLPQDTEISKYVECIGVALDI
jgi:Tfp pilus assembly PilM family ATPase